MIQKLNYKAVDDTILLEVGEDFNIEQILECGQCFRFSKIGDMSYTIVAKARVLNIKQEGKCVAFSPCNTEDFENIWIDYFDLNTDYSEIKRIISENDEIMQRAVKYGGGIRLLNQDCYEALISFIISQNNNIPRIKGIIERMSERYGIKCGDKYLFPTAEQIGLADVDELSELRVGFRAKYIRDALDRLQSGELSTDRLRGLNTEEAGNELLKIKGVGRKVADCVLLFSLRHREVFPTDVWVKRVMSRLYFGGEDTDIKTIHSYAGEKWGRYAGYAQQYLFYYARSEQLGK